MTRQPERGRRYRHEILVEVRFRRRLREMGLDDYKVWTIIDHMNR